MTNPANPSDVAARWRPLSAQESTVAATLLGDAWVMLRRRMEARDVDIELLIAADDVLAADVTRVLATAVIRVLKNPDGKSREQIDDYSWALDSAVSSGALYFSDDELNGIAPGSGESGGVFTIDPLANFADRFLP